jgi:hypothetical protein
VLGLVRERLRRFRLREPRALDLDEAVITSADRQIQLPTEDAERDDFG